MSKSNPDFHVFAVSENDYFTRIGGAWKNKNGNEGFFIRLNAYPIDGRILLLPPRPKDNDNEVTTKAG